MAPAFEAFYATLGAEQPLRDSDLLSYSDDSVAPVKDAMTAVGNVVLPSSTTIIFQRKRVRASASG